MLLDKFVKENGDLLGDKEVLDLSEVCDEITENNVGKVKDLLNDKAYKALKAMLKESNNGDGGGDSSSGPVYKKLTKIQESITVIDELDKTDIFNLAKAGIEHVTDDNVEKVKEITGKELSLDDFEESLVGVGKSGYKDKRDKYTYYAIKLEEGKKDGVLYEGISYAKTKDKEVNSKFVVKAVDVGGNTYMDVRFPSRRRTYREKDRDYLVSEIYDLVQRLEGQKTIDAQKEMYAEDDNEGGDE